MKSLAWNLVFFLSALLSGCSDDRGRLAGSGSVTTNGFSGTVTRDGLPASGIKVMLYGSGYDPVRDGAIPDSRKRITDRSGSYRFENLVPGHYSLVANHPTESTSAVIADQIIVDGDTVLILPEAALLPEGSINLGIPETARIVGAHYYLPGMGISAFVDSTAAREGVLSIPHVPAALYPALIYVAPGGDSGRNILTAPLRVEPEGTGRVTPFIGWKRAYRIAINTTASGADVSEDQIGFPLLVRLTSPDFDFSAAKADGSDLRVTKSDSATPLAFEVESWDPSAKTAEIWIRTDTLRGTDSSQYLLLFSGNPGASEPAVGESVFDTASGFSGVWHLGESPVKAFQREAVIRDRTGNGFHGIPDGAMAAEASVAGIVGKGLLFDGKDDHVELPASRLFVGVPDQSLTLSAWIRPGAIQTVGDSVRHRLLSFKTDTSGISALAWGIGNDKKLSHYSRASDSVYHWNTAVVEDSVYHVALTFASGRFTAYVNGRQDFTVSGAGLAAGGIHPVLLGAHLQGNRNFQGLIDELRIERVPRRAGWLALCYATQRPGSTVVRLRP
ncbi:MAG: flagellar motor protein MotA [Fibrobacteres bacterium]|nr:flagellar motor protein MotA [Fibrobacterota bacterium]